MHVLIATAGVLPPTPVADLTDKLLGRDGRVSVMTVVEIPATLLAAMADGERRSFLIDDWELPDRSEKAGQYMDERGRKMVEPVLAALRSRGHEPDVLFVDGSDPVEAIIETAGRVQANLIIMGATRPLFTDESWRSISGRVMQRTRLPLLLIPGQRGEEVSERSDED